MAQNAVGFKIRYLIPLILIFLFVAGSALYYNVNVLGRHREEIDAIADQAAARHGVPAALVKAIIWRESRYRVDSVGKAGEVGLMQLHTTSVREWSQRTGCPAPSRAALFKPETNIDIGTWYLSWTGSHWKGYKSALLLQISEYNAGYGNLTKGWLPKNPMDEVRPEDITIKSTRGYVRDVMQRMKIYEDR